MDASIISESGTCVGTVGEFYHKSALISSLSPTLVFDFAIVPKGSSITCQCIGLYMNIEFGFTVLAFTTLTSAERTITSIDSFKKNV